MTKSCCADSQSLQPRIVFSTTKVQFVSELFNICEQSGDPMQALIASADYKHKASKNEIFDVELQTTALTARLKINQL